MDLYTVIIVLFAFSPYIVERLSGQFIHFAVIATVAISLHGAYLIGLPALSFLLISYVISTIAELISLKTPINFFGIPYRYTIKHPFYSSGIRFLGVYPLEISLAWVLCKYLSFMIVLIISAAFSLSPLLRLFLTPLVLVSLDLILDPVAVKGNLWSWKKGSNYFGIPYQNFLGWYLVGLISTFLFGLTYTVPPITFHLLYILPIIFYASFLENTFKLMKVHKPMAIMGSLPAITWTILGSVSLIILFLRA